MRRAPYRRGNRICAGALGGQRRSSSRLTDFESGAQIGGQKREDRPERRFSNLWEALEGREGFEPSTPVSKVRACTQDPSAPTADSKSADLAAWPD